MVHVFGEAERVVEPPGGRGRLLGRPWLRASQGLHRRRPGAKGPVHDDVTPSIYVCTGYDNTACSSGHSVEQHAGGPRWSL